MAEVKQSIPTLASSEKAMLLMALENQLTSYRRAQKQRPEFAEAAKRCEDDITALMVKVRGIWTP